MTSLISCCGIVHVCLVPKSGRYFIRQKFIRSSAHFTRFYDKTSQGNAFSSRETDAEKNCKYSLNALGQLQFHGM